MLQPHPPPSAPPRPRPAAPLPQNGHVGRWTGPFLGWRPVQRPLGHPALPCLPPSSGAPPVPLRPCPATPPPHHCRPPATTTPAVWQDAASSNVGVVHPPRPPIDPARHAASNGAVCSAVLPLAVPPAAMPISTIRPPALCVRLRLTLKRKFDCGNKRNYGGEAAGWRMVDGGAAAARDHVRFS